MLPSRGRLGRRRMRGDRTRNHSDNSACHLEKYSRKSAKSPRPGLLSFSRDNNKQGSRRKTTETEAPVIFIKTPVRKNKQGKLQEKPLDHDSWQFLSS